MYKKPYIEEEIVEVEDIMTISNEGDVEIDE